MILTFHEFTRYLNRLTSSIRSVTKGDRCPNSSAFKMLSPFLSKQCLIVKSYQVGSETSPTLSPVRR